MPKSPYTESTFKSSGYTHYHVMGAKVPTPYGHIFIQAPRGVADDCIRNAFELDPHGVTCSHCGEDFSVSEDVSVESVRSLVCEWSSNVSAIVFRADAVPYLASGAWKFNQWVRK